MRRIVFCILVASVLIFSGPFSAHAAGLVPCGGATEPPCELCKLVDLGQNIINFGILAAVLLSGLMFAYAGVLYFTAAANEGQIKKAHGIFGTVFIGLLLVLGAWLIVDTVMKSFLPSGSVNVGKIPGPWNDIQCVPQPTPEPLSQGLINVLNAGTPSALSGQCNRCETVAAFACKPGVSCNAAQDLNLKLGSYATALGTNANSLQTTEGWPPQYSDHVGNSLHNTGEAVDMSFINSSDYTPTKVSQVLNAARSVPGLSATFETPDQTTYIQMRNAGVPAEWNTSASANHFHVSSSQ